MDAYMQAEIMLRRQDVYAPLYHVGTADYYMPVFQQLTEPAQLVEALVRLRQLWLPRYDPRVHDANALLNHWHAVPAARTSYQMYMAQKAAHPDLTYLTIRLQAETNNTPGLVARDCHGDATVENVMVHQGQPVWIDPSCTSAPREVELDIGKLYQSYYGYHPMPWGFKDVLFDFFNTLPYSRPLAAWYFATHLVRLWDYQPEKRKWVLEVTEAMNAGNTDPCV